MTQPQIRRIAEAIDGNGDSFFYPQILIIEGILWWRKFAWENECCCATKDGMYVDYCTSLEEAQEYFAKVDKKKLHGKLIEMKEHDLKITE